MFAYLDLQMVSSRLEFSQTQFWDRLSLFILQRWYIWYNCRYSNTVMFSFVLSLKLISSVPFYINVLNYECKVTFYLHSWTLPFVTYMYNVREKILYIADEAEFSRLFSSTECRLILEYSFWLKMCVNFLMHKYLKYSIMSQIYFCVC